MLDRVLNLLRGNFGHFFIADLALLTQGVSKKST